ncbi:MAG: esterase-like activity of phytase family protein [Gammaproteobacteria bacterium]|nr:esterase-like activity of phytase family protein [Gammaproteobacteria bacterium]
MKIAALWFGVFCAACTHTASDRGLTLQFLGEVTFPTGYQYNNIEMGGLSGIDYDPLSDRYIAISDDRAQRGPVRFYDLEIDLSDGSLDSGDIVFTGVTTILDKDDKALKLFSVDPEAIRFAPKPGKIYWSSEGSALTPPFVRVMSLDGKFLDEFSVAERYTPTPASGTRNNKGFEALTFGFNPDVVITAVENSLRQDGPAASPLVGSPVRVLQMDAISGQVQTEHIYLTDAVIVPPTPENAFSTNGLVELLTLDEQRILALERSYSTGVGNSVRLYLTTFDGASNVVALDSIAGQEIIVMPKRLLFDFNELGLRLDNLEGMTFGPRLAERSRTLLLVSDNNFNEKGGQFTQFLAFRLDW